MKNKSKTIQEICKIVLSAKRDMPAHFTSNAKRTQSFCVDFTDIDETDEYCMASEAWYEGGKAIAELYKEFGESENDDEQKIIMRIGEDIMIGSYIAAKLGIKNPAELLQKLIIDGNLQKLDDSAERDTTIHMINTPQVQAYFRHCREYASNR